MKSYISIPRKTLDACRQGSDITEVRAKAWHDAYEKREDFIICEIVEAVDVRPRIEITQWEE